MGSNGKKSKKQNSVHASLKLTGNIDNDRALIVFYGNCIRDEYIQSVRGKYIKRRYEHIVKENENWCNWEKHAHTKAEWTDFQNTLPPKMVERIQKKYPFLSAIEIWICCLLYFYFKPNEIAKILRYSPNTVHTKISRIRRKLNISGKYCIARFFENNPWAM